MTLPEGAGAPALSWVGIARLGLVQAALGAVVVLMTSTLNRVMVVELALPALLPGLLVALHYLVQLMRPRMGHAGDVGGRRTPWIVGGMALLAAGGIGAAASTVWMASAPVAGTVAAFASFVLIGLGLSAAGTSLLVLLAKRVDAPRRAPAATLVWVMMIAGFALTATLAGHWLDPYTPTRLLGVTTVVSLGALALATVALWGLEGRRADAGSGAAAPRAAPTGVAASSFRRALAETWADAPARRFTVFVFVSMLAFSAQDLILEPFVGTVFGWTPGQTTSLSGTQHGGVLAGMLLVAAAGRLGWGSMRAWCVGGCLASGAALLALAATGSVGGADGEAAVRPVVAALGVANGAFSIAAIGSMMRMAGEGGGAREGVRMGLWGAAQAIAFALGGLAGAAGSDATRAWLGQAETAYAAVFTIEALLFVVAAGLAFGLRLPPNTRLVAWRPLRRRTT
jgi:MFS transporter, BCD family, chlorophyll transporter